MAPKKTALRKGVKAKAPVRARAAPVKRSVRVVSKKKKSAQAVQQVLPRARLSVDAQLLLVLLSLRTIFDLFLGTFLISFIMHNSASEIIAISQHSLFLFFTFGAGLYIIANWVKRRNKVAVFRFSIIPSMVCLAAIAFFGDAMVDYIILLGVIIGISDAMWWLPMHCMIGEKVASESMTKFTGYRKLVNRFTLIVSPIVLGLFITVGSYEQMAAALLVICFMELIITFFLSPSYHRSKKKPDFGGFWRCMMQYPVIRKIFRIEILRGVSVSGALGVVITMYMVYMFKTDFMLGMFKTIFSIFALITSFLFGKFATRAMFPTILVASSIAALSSLVLFVLYTEETTFLLFNFINVTAIGLLNKITQVNMYNMSKSSCVSRDHKVEYFIFRDTALSFGRLAAFAGLFLIGWFGGYEWLRWYLIPVTLAVVLVGLGSVRINQDIE